VITPIVVIKGRAQEAMAMTTTISTRTPWLTRAAWAGLIGPVLFTVTWMAQELFRIEEYSPIQEPVSALAAGPHGWVQNVNFVMFGLLTLAFAAGVYRGLPLSRASAGGSALFAVSGIALLGAATFPLREDAAGVTYDPGGHMPFGVLFFGSSAFALLVISFALARDPRTRRFALVVRVAGIMMLVSNPVMAIAVIPDEAPLHDWAGLAQRVIVLGLLFPARLGLAYRLLTTYDAKTNIRATRDERQVVPGQKT
jgi:hypothetical membrane protein